MSQKKRVNIKIAEHLNRWFYESEFKLICSFFSLSRSLSLFPLTFSFTLFLPALLYNYLHSMYVCDVYIFKTIILYIFYYDSKIRIGSFFLLLYFVLDFTQLTVLFIEVSFCCLNISNQNGILLTNISNSK